MAETNEKLVTLPILQYYDTKSKAWVKEQISSSISDLGTIFTLKGTVDTLDDLPIENNAAGDVYLVGEAGSDTFEEYYWTGSAWEFMGTSAFDVSEVVTNEALYEGEDGTGTVANPAEGTIIYAIYNKMNDLTERVEAAETNISNLQAALENTVTDSDIDDMFA